MTEKVKNELLEADGTLPTSSLTDSQEQSSFGGEPIIIKQEPVETLDAIVEDLGQQDAWNPVEHSAVAGSLNEVLAQLFFNEKPCCATVGQTFSCTLCEKSFSRRHKFNDHLLTHDEYKRFSCIFCQKRFSSSWRLAVHTRTHTGEKPYACPHCQKSFAVKSTLTRHLQTHTRKKHFSCHLCGKSFAERWHLTCHVRTHPGQESFMRLNVKKAKLLENGGTLSTTPPLTGNQDNPSFGEEPIMKQKPVDETFDAVIEDLGQDALSHGKPTVVDGHNQGLAQLPVEEPCTMKPLTGQTYFFCIYCDKSFCSKYVLKRHMMIHTKPFPCSICQKSFSDSYKLKLHMEIHADGKPFSCDICDKSFTRSRHLKAHLTTHTGERPLSCNFCDKLFVKKSDLQLHLRTHTGEKPFSCIHCDKSFCSKHQLKQHVMTHTGEKPYECPHCQKSFALRSALTRHFRTHTGEKPFSCNLCGRSFAERGPLKYHVKTHSAQEPFNRPVMRENVKAEPLEDDGTLSTTPPLTGNQGHPSFGGEPIVKQEPVDETFDAVIEDLGQNALGHGKHSAVVDGLNQGLAQLPTQHTGEQPSSCKFCDKLFARNSNLQRHLRTHTGEKPFVCPLCQKSFALRQTLKVHIRTHTKEKPFSCHLCGKSFAQSSTLKYHVNTHIKWSQSTMEVSRESAFSTTTTIPGIIGSQVPSTDFTLETFVDSDVLLVSPKDDQEQVRS